VDMFQKGENHSHLAKALNIVRKINRKVSLKLQETRSVIDKKGSVRPKKLTDRETRILSRTRKKYLCRTARQIISESGINTTVVIRTIQSFLSRKNY